MGFNKTTKRVCIAGGLALLASSLSAQPYRAENRLIVVPLDKGRFEVIEARGEGARGLWCAAASFAQEQLGIARGSSLFVHSPRGASASVPSAKGVVFTVRQADLTVPSFKSNSVSVRSAGQSLPVHHARQFCRDYFIELEDQF